MRKFLPRLCEMFYTFITRITGLAALLLSGLIKPSTTIAELSRRKC